MLDPTLELRDLDLNLLLALHVLLEEQSVSRAARRLGRTQSATSRMLGRLRDALGDPLLVRTGHGMRSTPRADAARPGLAAALAALAEVRQLGGVFDPARATRRFVLAGPDALAPIATAVLQALQDQAPGCALTLLPAPPHPAPAVLGGGVDLVLGPDREVGADLRRQHLGTVRWVTVVRPSHGLADGPLTLERFCAHPHVQVRTGNADRSVVDVVLDQLGHTRAIQVTTAGLLAALHLVAETNLVATVPEALVVPVASRLGLVIRPTPLPLPEVSAVAWWSPRVHPDPAHQWFRRVVAEAARRALERPE